MQGHLQPRYIPFKGQITEQTTVKWPIGLQSVLFQLFSKGNDEENCIFTYEIRSLKVTATEIASSSTHWIHQSLPASSDFNQ